MQNRETEEERIARIATLLGGDGDPTVGERPAERSNPSISSADRTSEAEKAAPLQDVAEARSMWRARLVADGFKPAVLDDEVIDLAILLRSALSTDNQVAAVFSQMTGPELTAARIELQALRAYHRVEAISIDVVPFRGAIGHLVSKAPFEGVDIAAANAAAERVEEAEERAALDDGPAQERLIAANVILRSTLERILGGELGASEHAREACFSALAEAARITGDAPPTKPNAGAVMRADIRTRANIKLGLRDRVKVLLGGRVRVEIAAQTEHDAGRIGPVQRAVSVELPSPWARPPMWHCTLDPK